uniref:Cyclic nucleotide-binding domain-containing protein n=1 Tax=Guillardia theta TaxID=55529 RepID=A0A7S4U7Y4_GUITH
MKMKRKSKETRAHSEALERIQGHLLDVGCDLKLYRGSATKLFEYMPNHTSSDIMKTPLPFLIFHPFANMRLAWDIIIMLLLVWNMIVIPLRIAFENASSCESSFLKQDTIFYVDFAMDLIFMIDVPVTFRTAFLDKKPDTGEVELVTNWMAIARRYAKGVLFIDIVSSIPFDLILLSFCDGQGNIGPNGVFRSPKMLKLIRLVRLVRLLRMSRMRVFLMKIKDRLSINPGLLRLLQFIALMLIILHYNACVAFFLGEIFLDQSTQSWTVDKELYAVVGGRSGLYPVHDMEMWQQYVVSFYWTITTLTTVGWGDITPKTTPEVVFTILVLIEGGAAFSYMVGNMATLINKINPRQLRYKESMAVWEDFMHRENLPTYLRQKIRAYKNYKYTKPLASLPEFAKEELSRTMLREIVSAVYSEHLKSFKMFKGLPEQSLMELALVLKPIQVSPGEVLYREGQLGNCMYFLHSGEVELNMLLMTEKAKKEHGVRKIENTVLSEESDLSGEWVANISSDARTFSWRVNRHSASTCFGENCLTSDARLSTAITRTWCVLFILERDKLYQIQKRDPDLEVVLRRMKRAKASRLMKYVRRVIQGARASALNNGIVLLEVLEASELPKMDAFFGKVDAYCKIWLGSRQEASKRVFQTSVVYSSFDPKWNETFLFPMYESSMQISITVWDHDLVGDDEVVGRVNVDIRDIVRQCRETGTTQDVSMTLHILKVDEQLRELKSSVKGYRGKHSKLSLRIKCIPAGQEGGLKLETRTTSGGLEKGSSTLQLTRIRGMQESESQSQLEVGQGEGQAERKEGTKASGFSERRASVQEISEIRDMEAHPKLLDNVLLLGTVSQMTGRSLYAYEVSSVDAVTSSSVDERREPDEGEGMGASVSIGAKTGEASTKEEASEISEPSGVQQQHLPPINQTRDVQGGEAAARRSQNAEGEAERMEVHKEGGEEDGQVDRMKRSSSRTTHEDGVDYKALFFSLLRR